MNMTNEQYLNYVMLTEPQYNWSMVVYEHVVENKIKNWKEGFDFIMKWSSGKHSKGDTYRTAYWLLRYDLAKIEWVMNVIEEAECFTGTPCLVAAFLVSTKHVDVDWAIKIIEKEYSLEASDAARNLKINGHISDIQFRRIQEKIEECYTL